MYLSDLTGVGCKLIKRPTLTAETKWQSEFERRRLLNYYPSDWHPVLGVGSVLTDSARDGEYS